ncbi:MAG: malate:quinone oxidoreductase [Micrococcaceae bacterium]
MRNSENTKDIVLIGGGIMSATLATFIKQLEPNWSIDIYERLDEVALESSNAWNNAGTGHSALCELNYTTEEKDGSINIQKAIDINEKFQVTKQYWASLVEQGIIEDPSSFLTPITHASFVWGKQHSEFLEKRYEKLKPQKLFEDIQFTDQQDEIAEFAPLLMKERNPEQQVAASRFPTGTDVDFGALTKLLFDKVTDSDANLHLEHHVSDIKRDTDGTWKITIRDAEGYTKSINTRFVFIGAGGGALGLLQKTGIPQSKGFGGFPVSGQFLKTTNPELVAQHDAKVYGQAAVNAPPMSVPHLDTRVIDGERSLLFGPYAGFSTKFLKTGSYLDLPLSLKPDNLYPMVRAGLSNLPLTKYLVTEVVKKRQDKDLSLLEFMPSADPEDWELIEAGQRVQVIEKSKEKGGVLQFGTATIVSSDGTVSALLGASPGASTAPSIMLDILEKAFPARFDKWLPRIKDMIPGFKTSLNDNPKLADEIFAHSAKKLRIQRDFEG